MIWTIAACVGTFLLGFLTGVLTRGFGNYLGARLTDRHRRIEAATKATAQFKRIKQQMPKFIAEMKADLEKEGWDFVREFFLVPKRATLNYPEKHFEYYPEDYDDLPGMVRVLQNHAHVIDVTPGNAPKYRMTEQFVELVLRS